MKLQIFAVDPSELQDYLDKYEEKIKFVLSNTNAGSGMFGSNQIVLIIDVA